MKIRLFNPKEDYSKLTTWWEAHDWPAVHPASLSKNGFIVHDKEDIVAGWYIRTDTGTALCEWIVGNPEIKGKRKLRALKKLINYIEDRSKKDGYHMIMTFLEHKGLMNTMSKMGYTEGDKGMDIYVKGLR